MTAKTFLGAVTNPLASTPFSKPAPQSWHFLEVISGLRKARVIALTSLSKTKRAGWRVNQ
jgi:hypothetical protein